MNLQVTITHPRTGTLEEIKDALWAAHQDITADMCEAAGDVQFELVFKAEEARDDD